MASRQELETSWCLRSCSISREQEKHLQPDLTAFPDSAINGNWILSDFLDKEKGEKVEGFVISEEVEFLTGEERAETQKAREVEPVYIFLYLLHCYLGRGVFQDKNRASALIVFCLFYSHFTLLLLSFYSSHKAWKRCLSLKFFFFFPLRLVTIFC